MKILYCDEHIIVCIKPAGAVSMDEPGGMPELIRKAIGENHIVRTVHRLDSIVSGLMVYALSKEAASGLSGQMENGSFSKEYMAVLEGHPKKNQAELRDYLLRNKRERKTYVSNKRNRNAQEAILKYEVLGKGQELSLVKVKLITGRTHQIRCQFSSRNLPLYGDKKYGAVHNDARIALWSYRLSFVHPVTGKDMVFSALPPERVPWNQFQGYTESYEEQELVVEFQRTEKFSDCPYAEDCGFCTYQGMEYDKQLEKKQRKGSRWLRDLGNIEPIIPAEKPYGYRNKITIDFGLDKNGRLVSGIYNRKLHRIQRIGKCRINHPKLEEISAVLRSLLMKYEIPVYDEQKNDGWIQQAILRINSVGEVMVVLGAFEKANDRVLAMAEELEQTHPEMNSILLEIRGKNRKIIEKPQVLRGNAFLNDIWMGQAFQIYPDTFFPLNPDQSKIVYEKILDAVEFTGEERVLDVGCGIGVLTLAVAAKVNKIIGVDVSDNIVKEAKERAKEANAENIRLAAKEIDTYLNNLAGSKESFDIVFFEASRCRNTTDCINALVKLKADKIVYIGSDPESMGMDVEQLVLQGYSIDKIHMVDLMPFTEVCEILCFLSLK